MGESVTGAVRLVLMMLVVVVVAVVPPLVLLLLPRLLVPVLLPLGPRAAHAS